MSAPKSVVKIKKNGIEYTSNVDAAQYYIYELSRAALRDVGKFIKKEWQKAYDGHFKKRKGFGRKATSVNVIAGKSTQYPRVQIGLKTGKVDGFYAYFQEFGSSKQEKLGLLTKAAQDNIPKIVEIESQYLSGLSEEAERLNQLINEDAYEDEDE